MFYLVFAGKFQVQAPRGAYIRRGDLTGGVFCVTILEGLFLEGLIHGGAYFRNFTVYVFKGLCHNIYPNSNRGNDHQIERNI